MYDDSRGTDAWDDYAYSSNDWGVQRPLTYRKGRILDGDQMMNLNDMIESCTLDSKQWFPKAQTLPNMTLCLAGEVGEVANMVKKVVRGTMELDTETTGYLAEEVVDCLIYLCKLMGLK